MNATRLATVTVLLTALATLPLVARAQPSDTPRMGGVLKAAMIGEPPSLDLHWTTAVIALPLWKRTPLRSVIV